MPNEQVVLLSHILPSKATVGYSDAFNNNQVQKFNGQRIGNLRELVELVETCDAEYMEFEFDHGKLVVLNANQVITIPRCFHQALLVLTRSDQP